ncbi:MAG: hypothetical protein K6E29_00480 [Cyanobacteria bacterium RUI128]|nr:hypothetical protein [Cyanobacteria bacterium RUI128]
MNILFSVNNFSIRQNCPVNATFTGPSFSLEKSPKYDLFVKSNDNIQSQTISFTGSKKTSKTANPKKDYKSYEEQLKNIDGLHDPYSDVIMISQKKYRYMVNKIHKRTNAESMNSLMEGYTMHMFPSEKEVFELLKYETNKAKRRNSNQNLTYPEILQSYLPLAKARLVNSQFAVTDSIREYAKENMSKDEQKDVESYLTIIDKDIYNDRFRIKYARDLLGRLYDEVHDKSKVDKIIRLSHNFPNTATCSDAFIVKYANKSQEEIAELLVSPSQISIEHIKPSSEGGESKGDNYLAASKRMNNYRNSTPLDEIIERYPNIPKQTQRYIDDLIAKINRGGLTNIAYTLPGVKESLAKESNGRINIDISKLNPDLKVKIDEFQEKMNQLVEKFNS